MLVAGLFTCMPGAQVVNPVPAAGAGYAAQGGMTGDPQVRVMRIDDLNVLKNGNTDFLLVDARPREQYYMAHIPGAVSMPLNEISAYVSGLDRNRMIVTYCGNYHCPISTKAAMEFSRLGFTNVYDYKGGIKEWQEMGNAAATGSG
jgi:rhodanese-related sulfurtransferase